MSIADKITSIEGHLTDDYEGLENLGADLTNVNKNIQNIRTCLDNIYSNLPKTTGEGSNLSLSTIKGRINTEAVKGDTQQDTTTGKNKLQLNSGTYSNNGITITIADDGLITINGTASATTNFTGVGTFAYTTGTTYIGNCIYLSGTCTDYGGGIFFNKTSATGTVNDGGGAGFRTNTSRTFTINSDEASKTYYAYMTITSGNTFTNYKTYLQIVTGSTADYNYEPYTNGASPNPTYPQDINVVTGTQEVVVQNKNFCELSSISTTGGGYINYSVSQIAEVEQGKTYTLSLKNNTSYTSNVNVRISVGSSYSTETQGNLVANGIKTYTFTASQSGILNLNSRLGTEDIENAFTEIQLELGSTASSYVEHQEQTKTLHLGDIELAKIGTYQDRIFETSGKQMLNVTATSQTKNNIVFTIDNGVVNANGTANSSTGLVLGQVQLEAGKTYYLSGCASGGGSGKYTLSINAENDITRLADDRGSGTSYTPSTSGTYDIKLNYWYNYAISNLTFYPMINEGSTALPYEPYGSDKWYIEKNIDKFKFDGTETIRTTDYSIAYTITKDTITSKGFDVPTNTTNALSNCFSIVANQSEMGSIGKLRFGGTYVIFNYDNSVANPTAFKTLLDTTAYFYFPLATPTYTEITNTTLLEELNELEKMMSYNGTTNISVSGNLPMILDVSALKGE